MAEITMYDFLSSVTPQYDSTVFSVRPQNILVEFGSKNQVVHIGDDGSEERIGFSNNCVFFCNLEWDVLNEEDASTILDFWADENKANGMMKSFKWQHPKDGYQYVVRFEGNIEKELKLGILYGIKSIKLRVLGRI